MDVYVGECIRHVIARSWTAENEKGLVRVRAHALSLCAQRAKSAQSECLCGFLMNGWI